MTTSKEIWNDGVKCCATKFTTNDILDIRASSLTTSVLAKHYGVSTSAIKRIRSRQTFKNT